VLILRAAIDAWDEWRGWLLGALLWAIFAAIVVAPCASAFWLGRVTS